MEQNAISEKVGVSGCAKHEVQDVGTESARHANRTPCSFAEIAQQQHRSQSVVAVSGRLAPVKAALDGSAGIIRDWCDGCGLLS